MFLHTGLYNAYHMFFSLFYDYEKKCSELDLTSVHVEMNKKVITVFLDANNTSYDITLTFILSISINIF